MCTYRTTLDHVLFTVLDNKLLNTLAKQYKKKVDELYNKEEEIQVEKLKVKIGKEFLIKDTEKLSHNFDIEAYVEKNRKILQEEGLNKFLFLHGWTPTRLMKYFTECNSIMPPITSICF